MKIYIITILVLIIACHAACQITAIRNDTTQVVNNNKLLFENISFADSVIFYDPGAIGVNTGEEPLLQYQEAYKALGKPDCNSYKDTGFVSLGNGGTLIIQFKDNILINGPGADIEIFEVGYDEDIKVWISQDNKIYFPLRKHPSSDYKFEFQSNLKLNKFFKFIKIKDIYDLTGNTDSTDQALGADIDAVSALNTVKRITFIKDSLFRNNSIHLSDSGKNKLTKIANLIKPLNNSVIYINAYSHQKASPQYLSMSTNMYADIIHQYLFNEKKITQVEYHTSGKGYNDKLKYSIIEILIKPQ